MDCGATIRLSAALLISALVHLSLALGVVVVPPRGTGMRTVLTAQLRSEDISPPSVAGEDAQEQRPAPVARLQPPRREFFQPPPAAAQPGFWASRTMPGERTSDPEVALPPVEMPLLADPTWYAAKELDAYPRPLEPIRPQYPEPAVQTQLEGTVTLLVSVDETGRIQDVSVVDAVPVGTFEEVAVEALRRARFAPARREGVDVRSRIVVKLSFAPNTPH